MRVVWRTEVGDWRRSSRIRGGGWFVTAAAAVATAAAVHVSGCLVESRCFNDADCAPPHVCSDGRCVFECETDGDCEQDFGEAFVCDAHHCRYPTECVSCSFPHAGFSCVRGECEMGECEAGFHDLNGEAEDGCEYSCRTSNGGEEACDEEDNDCDGEVDEGFDLAADPDNCGACGSRCEPLPHADSLCQSATCVYICHQGWHDNNRQREDGCEASDCLPVEEVCDGLDNDCDCPGDTDGDGRFCGPGDEGVDEGFDKSLPETCGPYCIACQYDHAVALCVEGACRMGGCEPGFFDANGADVDGCECEPSNGDIERCDGLDNDCDGEVDEGGVCGTSCPEGMVLAGGYLCIDTYEASRPDATATDAGSDESVATSRQGVLPWMVNPMTYDHFLTFQAACRAAGKHLCTGQQWFDACSGPPPGTTYAFGNSFDKEICNCVDTFCEEYCEANGIAPASCSVGANCGYDYYCFHETPTGSFPGCTNEYGTLDMAGNVWEIVPSDTDGRGYEVRGGAFNCAAASTRLTCTFNAGWSELYAGFRCCSYPE